MSEHEREREQPWVLSARKAMSLLGEAPPESDSSEDESGEPTTGAGDPEDGS